jgi:hypothetical protein
VEGLKVAALLGVNDDEVIQGSFILLQSHCLLTAAACEVAIVVVGVPLMVSLHILNSGLAVRLRRDRWRATRA